jgi:hypothetical protein
VLKSTKEAIELMAKQTLRRAAGEQGLLSEADQGQTERSAVAL